MTDALGDVLAGSDERRVEGSDKVSITVRVRRYNPEVREESWWDEWEISMEPNDRLLDALHHIKWYEDGTLALRRYCADGICGPYAIVINCRNALACKVLVKDLAPKVTVEPSRVMRVLKYLIAAIDTLFEGYKKVLPY